jgi:hypothetical protein
MGLKISSGQSIGQIRNKQRIVPSQEFPDPRFGLGALILWREVPHFNRKLQEVGATRQPHFENQAAPAAHPRANWVKANLTSTVRVPPVAGKKRIYL